MKTKIKMEPRVSPKVQQKMVLIYTVSGIALAGIFAILLFFYLNTGHQEEAYAKNKTYTSERSGDWNSPSTWQSGKIPPISGLDKDVIIINNKIDYIGNVSANNQASITINGGGSLTITGDFEVKNFLTLMINGELIIRGSLSAKNGAQVTVNGGGTASITQDVSFDNNTNLWIDGNLEVGETLKFGNNSNFGGNGVAFIGLADCSEWSGPPGNCADNITLPIELYSFSARREGKEVIIKWQTSVEINNDYFNIERSSDAKKFEQIATIEGSGTSHKAINYEYVDRYPLNKLSYYRLRQTDFDGKTEVFDIHTVEASLFMANNIRIFPNPLLGNTLKMVIDQPEQGNVVILDERGQVIFTHEFTDGGREQEMNLPEKMKSGLYFVNVTLPSLQKSFKLVKK